jgi:hypothetical protein
MPSLVSAILMHKTFNSFVVGLIPAQPLTIAKGLRENVALFFVQNFNADLMCCFLLGNYQRFLAFLF